MRTQYKFGNGGINVPDQPRPRVLFVAGISPGDNSTAHIRVLREFGCDVEVVNSKPYMTRGGGAASWLRFRTLMGPTISELNQEILTLAERFKPHVLWAEKPIGVRPVTLVTLRDMGVVLSCLTYDNPFGNMGEPLWRLFRKSLTLFDLHIVPRRVSEIDFTKAGARQIRSDAQMSERVIRSYRLMLRFYGMRLADERTGAVERDPEDDGSRIGNFNNSPHNFLRISRILTSLGELGFHR